VEGSGDRRSQQAGGATGGNGELRAVGETGCGWPGGTRGAAKASLNPPQSPSTREVRCHMEAYFKIFLYSGKWRHPAPALILLYPRSWNHGRQTFASSRDKHPTPSFPNPPPYMAAALGVLQVAEGARSHVEPVTQCRNRLHSTKKHTVKVLLRVWACIFESIPFQCVSKGTRYKPSAQMPSGPPQEAHRPLNVTAPSISRQTRPQPPVLMPIYAVPHLVRFVSLPLGH
jgi:hypothetical protein